METALDYLDLAYQKATTEDPTGAFVSLQKCVLEQMEAYAQSKMQWVDVDKATPEQKQQLNDAPTHLVLILLEDGEILRFEERIGRLVEIKAWFILPDTSKLLKP